MTRYLNGTDYCPICKVYDGFHSPDCNMGKVIVERDAAVAAKEESERKACAMRSALDRSDMRNDISIACFEAGHKSENNLIDSIVDAVRQPLEAALTSSAPCRHEEAVEWIAATLMDEKHWGEVSNADIVAELRRIAGGVK